MVSIRNIIALTWIEQSPIWPTFILHHLINSRNVNRLNSNYWYPSSVKWKGKKAHTIIMSQFFLTERKDKIDILKSWLHLAFTSHTKVKQNEPYIQINFSFHKNPSCWEWSGFNGTWSCNNWGGVLTGCLCHHFSLSNMVCYCNTHWDPNRIVIYHL